MGTVLWGGYHVDGSMWTVVWGPKHWEGSMGMVAWGQMQQESWYGIIFVVVCFLTFYSELLSVHFYFLHFSCWDSSISVRLHLE